MREQLPIIWIAALGLAALMSVTIGTARDGERPADGKGEVTSGPAAYPFDWCPVSGKELIDKQESETLVYEGKTLEFCCTHCRESFEKDPVRYLSKFEPAWPWNP